MSLSEILTNLDFEVYECESCGQIGTFLLTTKTKLCDECKDQMGMD